MTDSFAAASACGSAADRQRPATRAVGTFGGGGDVLEHAAKDDAMKRRDGPPVGMTCESARLEDGLLDVGHLPAVVLADRHLQPRQARQLHLRAQPQEFSR